MRPLIFGLAAFVVSAALSGGVAGVRARGAMEAAAADSAAHAATAADSAGHQGAAQGAEEAPAATGSDSSHAAAPAQAAEPDTASSPSPRAPAAVPPAGRPSVELGAARLAAVFGGMRPEDAGRVIEKMTDAEVVLILRHLDERKVGQILSKLSAERAASLTRATLAGGGTAQ